MASECSYSVSNGSTSSDRSGLPLLCPTYSTRRSVSTIGSLRGDWLIITLEIDTGITLRGCEAGTGQRNPAAYVGCIAFAV